MARQSSGLQGCLSLLASDCGPDQNLGPWCFGTGGGKEVGSSGPLLAPSFKGQQAFLRNRAASHHQGDAYVHRPRPSAPHHLEARMTSWGTKPEPLPPRKPGFHFLVVFPSWSPQVPSKPHTEQSLSRAWKVLGVTASMAYLLPPFRKRAGSSRRIWTCPPRLL